MNWWGKMIGSSVGLLGGPIGGLIGGYIGHKFDQSRPQIKDEKEAKLLYYAYFFSSAAKIAKANGQISQQEIEKVESIIQRMGISAKEESFAKNVFRKSRTNESPIVDDFKGCSKLIKNNQSIAYSFMGGLFEIATCDPRKLSKAQVQCLLLGEECFKMPKGTIRSWYAGGYIIGGMSSDQNDFQKYYEILGVSPSADLDTIKNIYRKKIRAMHPDKLLRKELPDELIALANEQVIRINLAFEKIKEQRKFK